MSEVQNRVARGFVNAASFHSDKTIFYTVDAADAVFAAQFVQCLHHLKWRQFGGRSSCDAGTASPARTELAGARPSSCNESAISRFKMKLDIFGLVRRILGRHAQLIHVTRFWSAGIEPRIFQHPALETNVEKVAIHRVRFRNTRLHCMLI